LWVIRVVSDISATFPVGLGHGSRGGDEADIARAPMPKPAPKRLPYIIAGRR
jgi:hypothetical protein